MSASAALGLGTRHPLGDAFLRWQCRVRQIAMREGRGRPDDAVMPVLTLPGADEPLGHVITVLNRQPAHALVPELEHIAAREADPARRREKALELFSETYFQQARQFTDMLTATFPPRSAGAEAIRAAGACRLRFAAYAQRFDLAARVWRLAEHHPLHRATLAHNRLFNPALPPGTVVLGFEPDWTASSADPDPR